MITSYTFWWTKTASHKEALEVRDKKTITAPHWPDDRNGAPLLKAASSVVTSIILAPNWDNLENGKT